VSARRSTRGRPALLATQEARADDPGRAFEILGAVKSLAREYYELTGRPMGVTGEVAEYEAARILGLELAPVRQSGYDAIRRPKRGKKELLQIKGRYNLPRSLRGQRTSSFNVKDPWDAALLVGLDQDFEAVKIWEASRTAVLDALSLPGSEARSKRRSLTVSKFIAIGDLIWERSGTPR
jgi:hypothetical protein